MLRPAVSALAFPGDYSMGGKDNQRLWVKPGLSQNRHQGHQKLDAESAARSWCSQLLTKYIHPQAGRMAALESPITTKFTISPTPDVMMHKDTNLTLELLTSYLIKE